MDTTGEMNPSASNPDGSSSVSSTATTFPRYSSLRTDAGDDVDTAKHSSSDSTTTGTLEQLLPAQKVEELRKEVKEKDAVTDRSEWEAETSSTADTEQRMRQLKRDVKATGSIPSKRSTVGLFKTVCSCDLLFLIDTTRSMDRHIKAAKEQVKSIIADITDAFLGEAEVRIAIVGYKDHGDKPNIESLDFTKSAEEAREFLKGLSACGGGDTPEDVLGGIRKALNATWKHPTRCIIHIADAPPHGRDLQDPPIIPDRWPETGTEPHRLTLEPLVTRMIDLKINYGLLRIHHRTDLMASIIHQAYMAASGQGSLLESNNFYTAPGETKESSLGSSAYGHSSGSGNRFGLMFEEAALGTTYSALRPLVVNTVKSSVSSTLGRMSASPAWLPNNWKKALNKDLGSIGEEVDHAEGAPLETGAPQWSDRGWFTEKLTVEGFCPDVVIHSADTLNELMADDKNIKMSTAELSVRKRPQPFAQGALRLATYALTKSSSDRFVVKTYKRDDKRLAHLAEDMRCQALCKAFALEFNALSGTSCIIDFVVTTCFRDRRGTTKECMSLEPFLEGTYVKYNSNRGWVNEAKRDDPFNREAQAFSHFTFERSQGRFLVNDLQGVGGKLTDPVVHARDPKRFKLSDTNLGAEGFKFFFASHECNDLCRKLNLQSNRSMMKTGIWTYRQDWPSTSDTLCCSNRLCGRIMHASGAKESKTCPGYRWCETCYPQLEEFTSKRICLAQGTHHEFEESAFLYQSQGQMNPQMCAEHRGGEKSIVRWTSKISHSQLHRLFNDSNARGAAGPRLATFSEDTITPAPERASRHEVDDTRDSSHGEGDRVRTNPLPKVEEYESEPRAVPARKKRGALRALLGCFLGD